MKLLSLLFPYVCPVCLEPVAGGRFAVHEKCRKSRIYVTEPFCMRCGRPMREDKEYCEQCQDENFSYDAGRCIFLYHSKIGHSIAEFKNKGFSDLPWYFGEMAVRLHGPFIKATGASQIIPVPVSSRRLRVRGFNQSERLALALSKRTGIAMEPAVEKIKDTAEQKTLGKRDRQRNLQGSFRVKKGKSIGKSVIVVDDIFTTGSTIAAMASTLKKAGAERVYFVCAASAHS